MSTAKLTSDGEISEEEKYRLLQEYLDSRKFIPAICEESADMELLGKSYRGEL